MMTDAKPAAPPLWHNSMPDWYRDGQQHIWMPYAQMATAPQGLPVVGADGVWIELADGRRLIDGLASWWTMCHGYNHPHIAAAMKAQIESLPHVMFGGLVHEPALRLAKRLSDILPGDLNHVFFSDSGSVAVEIALKMALQFWTNQGITGRTRFLCFRGGYHGDTMAAMSVTDREAGMHRNFANLLPDNLLVDLPRNQKDLVAFENILEAHHATLAGLIVEPLVQAAGGMLMTPPEIFSEIAKLAQHYKLILIADEIFTGFGRTGSLFACDQAGVVPDIICLGKALSGGAVSLAATVTGDRVYEAFLSDDPQKALMHGPTYMANALACAAANASLDLFERAPRLDQVKRIESALHQALMPCKELAPVKDIRILGAIGAIELDNLADPQWFRERFIEEGVWLRPLGNVIYLTPSFTISDDELKRLTGAVVRVVQEWAALKGC